MFRLRLAVVFATALLTLTVAAVAQAASNTYCSPPSGTTGSTTYIGTDGDWGDGDNWTNGQPDDQCDAVIPAGVSVTLSTVAQAGTYGNGNGSAPKGLTINPGATVLVEGISSQVQGNASNSTELTIGSDGLIIDPGATLHLEATGMNSTANPTSPAGGSAQLLSDGSQTTPINNMGTIIADSVDSPTYGETISWNGAFTNSGTLDVSSGTLMAQNANYPQVLDNTGTVDVASGATVSTRDIDVTNSGTFVNQGTTTMYANGLYYWAQAGGSETVNPVELTGGMELHDSVGAGSFDYTNCAGGYLSGTIPAGQTVTVTGGCSGTTAYLGSSDGGSSTVVNHGTLVLDAPVGPNGSDAILAGGELENYGTLDSSVGGPTPLANQLLVPLINEAGGTVAVSGGELAQTSGSTTDNAGTADIGPGATWLVQGGAFTNTGTASPQIASAGSVGTFNLTAGGKFTAGGALTPALMAGYVPAIKQEFPIITLNGGSVDGTFGSVSGGFAADYTKETASSPYVGVVYDGPSTGPAPKPSRAPVTGTIKGGRGQFSASVSCPSSDSSCAAYEITGSVTEHLKGSKVSAVTARKTKATAKPKTKVVVVASRSGSVAAGKSLKLTLKLNRAGATLLKRFGKLKVLVTISSDRKTVRTETVTVTEPKPAKKKPKKKKK